MRLSLVLAMLVAGCDGGELPGSTVGQRGSLEFSIAADRPIGSECFIECGIEQPFLAGTHEDLWVRSHATTPDANQRPFLPVLRAASSDESVMTVVDKPCCAYPDGNEGCTDRATFDACIAGGGRAGTSFIASITFHAPGSAHLVLYTDDDPLFDQTVVEARDAAAVEIQQRHRDGDQEVFEHVGSLDLTANETVRLVARDAAGGALFASHGVALSVTGDAALFDGKQADTTAQTTDESSGELWPMKAGSETLLGRAGAVTVSVPVTSR